MATSNDKLIDSCNQRLSGLRKERDSYIPLWKELSDYILTERGRFLCGGERKGPRRNTKQFNNRALRSSRTLASGMMAGITSPARPWFKLSTRDKALLKRTAVTQWLYDVQQLMYQTFAASNFYNSIHMTYSELGTYGTGCMGIFEDEKRAIRAKSFTIGSYMLDLGADDMVDTFYREYERSVAQLVKEFGFDNCSRQVQEMWRNNKLDHMVPIVHVIEPNDDRNMLSPFNFDMPFRSIYYEKGAKAEGKLLAKSGFRTFPIMGPRWEVVGEEVYATMCPGRVALGDTKALQLGEKRLYQALDKVANPPLQGSVQSLGKNAQTPGPGEMITVSQSDRGLESVYKNFNPGLDSIAAVQDRTEARIASAFFEDLFLMLSMSDRRNITATEVVERHEEKLIVLGPVLERLHAELLNPVIDRTFDILEARGAIPPPPEELQGLQLEVEYVSILAQAQRMVGVSGLERTAAFTASLAGLYPEARHKLDPLQAIDDYSNMMGVSPRIIRGDDDVEQIMAQEAQAQQQAQQAAQLQQAAATAKDASQANLNGDNALTMTLRNNGLM